MDAKRIEDVKAKVAKAQAALEQQLAALQTSDDWRRTLERMAILGPTSIARFSFRNILLLLSQANGIEHAATFNTWRQKGRAVRKGEKALTILKPRFAPKKAKSATAPGDDKVLIGFSPMSVFAFEQTDGPELAEPLLHQNLETPEGFDWTVERTRELVKTLPGISDIALRHRGHGDHPTAHGWFEPATGRVVIILGETSPLTVTKTLLHEVAHAVLHGKEGRHSTPVQEVEAESTAFVVAHALGLDTAGYSLPYVATWATGGEDTEPTTMVAQVGERIRKAAHTILEALAPQADEDEESEAAAA